MAKQTKSNKVEPTIEEKVASTFSEMEKITDKVLSEVETPEVIEEKAETPETPEVIEEKAETPEVIEEKAETPEVIEEKAETHEVIEDLFEGDLSIKEKIIEIIKSENFFNYVSFGRHLNGNSNEREISENNLKLFADEFSTSGMLTSKNHYDLLQLFKEYYATTEE